MKNRLTTPFIIGFILMVMGLSACKPAQRPIEQDALVAHIDSTVKPGDDFFQFANGKWFKENPIPATEQSNGIFQLIQDTINAQVHNICVSAAAHVEKKGSNKQKIGDFYYAGMDSVSLNKKGISDLKEDLARIDEIKDLNGVIAQASFIHSVSSAPLFNFYITQDDENSAKYQIYIAQGGLTMPDRNYYVDMDKGTKDIRDKFSVYTGKMFSTMGYNKADAGRAAAKVLEMETALAKSSRKREDTRDPLKNYHKMPFNKLVSLTPNLDWSIFMKGVGLSKVDSVVVGQPEFLVALNSSLKKFTLNDWKDYLKFHLLDGLSPYFDDGVYKDQFDFYSTALHGMKEPKPRWQRVVSNTDRYLGELIGQVYVEEYLPKGTKEKLLEIGNAIKSEFAQRIKSLDWMSEPTKVKALKKLDAVIMKVGYPDKWKDLSSMEIDRTSYVKNIMNANKWELKYMIDKYGKPVDRAEWAMQPQTYNAYYNPSNNEIVIPGCNILVPGYESKMADDAILYAIIGGTFGHEITHGFDDQGCKYNEQGNLNDWWTKEDKAKFDSKTKMIVNQFNNYIAVDSLHINGELTQGENIADLGGIIMAYEAFKRTNQYKENQIIAGLNPSKRFFLGYALEWMQNMRPEAIANQVKSNEHAPAKWRVNGALSNMPEFFSTFDIKQGDKMWRSDKEIVRIW